MAEGQSGMHFNMYVALDFTEGRLEKDQEAYWQRHMDACEECAKDILAWRQLAIDLKRSHLKSASPPDLHNVMAIFPAHQEEGNHPLRSLFAGIVFDSLLQPAMAGVRGASPEEERQIVMRAEEFDIHIKVWGDRDHRQMLGQLLPRDRPDFVRSARFHLLLNGERVESTTTDETGEFHFKQVPEGDLSLQIDLPNLTVIGALNVQEKP
jgi:hypothetical protein